MFWTLDFDDYSGQFCNEGTFPLANAIKMVFDEYNSVNYTNSVTKSIENLNMTSRSFKISDLSNKVNDPNVNSTNSVLKMTELLEGSTKMTYFYTVIHVDTNLELGKINELHLGFNESSEFNNQSIFPIQVNQAYKNGPIWIISLLNSEYGLFVFINLNLFFNLIKVFY